MKDLLEELEAARAAGVPVLDAVVDLSVRLRRIGLQFAEFAASVSDNVNDLEVLTMLHRRGAPYGAAQGVLAGHLAISPGALTGRLDALEVTGDVRRSRGQRDRRQRLVTLTDQGRARVDNAYALVQDLARAGADHAGILPLPTARSLSETEPRLRSATR